MQFIYNCAYLHIIQFKPYYRKRVNNPCGRCNYSCVDDCIQCIVCLRWYHRKCLKITKTKCKQLKETQNFTCTKNCEYTVFPFHSIGDKAFISINTIRKKFPCYMCTGECHKSMNRVKCLRCLRWAHLECLKTPLNKSFSSENFYCSVKCELSILPFYCLDSTDFDKLVCRGKLEFRQYRKKWDSRKSSGRKRRTKLFSPEPTPQCEYLEPDEVKNVVNDKCPNDLTIFHANVRSSQQNMEKLHDLFLDCNSLPDILGITETRLKGDKIKSDIPDYSFEHQQSYTEAGGTGIYIANYLDYTIRGDLEMGVENCEDKWIEVHAPKSHVNTKFKVIENLVVGMIYRHPGSQYKDFNEKLNNNIISINQSKKHFVIMGDVNINSLKMNIATSITDYLNDIQSAGCLSFVDKATRVVHKGNRWETSCIDHIYSNIQPERLQTYVVTSGISDHFSTMTKIVDAKNINVTKQTIYRRKKSLTSTEIKSFNKDLRNLISNNSFDCTTPKSLNEQTTHLISAYQVLIDKYMPLRKISNKEKKSLLKPWITRGIKVSIKVRDKLLRKSTRTKSDILYKEYKFYRNLITRLKKNSFNNYYRDKFQVNNKDKKKTWETVNEITNHKTRNKTQIANLKDEKGQDIRKSIDIANRLNHHFNSIGNKLAKKIETAEPNATFCGPEPPKNSIYMFDTNHEEIRKLIDVLKINKAPGIDGISNYIIKVSATIIIPTLVKLFNCCMNVGFFPDKLKIANIVPLHKGGDRADVMNYRPISLLPLLGKLFEKVIKKRFTKFLDKYNLINPHQFGFRKGYSTELAVAEVQNSLLKSLDNKKIACAVFLDLAKAFDTVDHKLLLDKLEMHGIRGCALSLIKSYLSDRTHLVTINDAKSSFLTLDIGVPQGSVLGPLLFLIFINDLPYATNLKVKLFADDTLLTMEAHNYPDLHSNVNVEVNKVHKWLSMNKLTLNTDKSKYMIITNKRKPNDSEFHVNINGKRLEKCHSYKYLGVHIDENLNWKAHVDYICEKVTKVCGIFAKLRHCVGLDILKMVYHALVSSHIQYCNLIWGNADENTLKPLQSLQNKVIKIMTFAPFSSNNVKEIYDDLELLNLIQIHKLSKAKFAYKHTNGLLPSNFDNYLCNVETTHNHNLRSSSNGCYRQIWGKTNQSFKMIQYDGAKLWNSIPRSIKTVESLKNFSQIYKIFLLNND